MAELMNKAGPGINLGRVKAAQVDPTVGTVRRDRVEGFDLSAVASGVNNYLDATRASKTAKAKEAANRIASEEAIGELEIIENFNFNTDEGLDRAAQLATGYTNDMGAPPSEEAYKALAGLQQFTDRVKNARAQGNSQAGLDMALIRYRRNFLAKHPEFGPEAIKATSDLTGAKPSGIDANARTESDVRQKEQETDKALRTFLSSRGDVMPSTATPEQVRQHYNTYYAPQVQEFTAAEQSLKQLQTDEAISDTQREIGIKTALRITQPGNVQGAMSFLTSQLQAGGSPEQRVQAIDGYLAQFQINVMQQEGFEDPAKFTQAYGQVLLAAQTAKDTIMKKDATVAVQTAVNMQDAVADRFIGEKFGLGQRVLQKVILPMANVVGPAVATQLFEKSAGPGQPAKIGYQVFQTATAIWTDPDAVSLDPFAPVQDTGSLVTNAQARNAMTRDGERAVSQLSRSLVDGFDQMTPEALTASADYWSRVVKSPYAAKSGTAWADIMDAMDSPRFGEFLDATNKREELSPVVVGNSRRYALSLLAEMDALLKGKGEPKFSYNKATKTLAVDPSSIAGLDPASRDRYILTSRRVGQALRVLHEKFGQGESIPALVGEMTTMGE